MWSPICDFISLDPKIERTNKMQTPDNRTTKSTLETIEESIQKAELEKKKIIKHLNYLYKEYYTSSKNKEKRENEGVGM